MVFRLSHDISKDGEDSNNNQTPLGLNGTARRSSRSAPSTASHLQDGDEVGDDGCCTCCCGPAWFHRRHSAKVSPQKRQVFDLDGMYTVLDVQPPQQQFYDAPLTLDSIDSSSESQLQHTHHVPPQKPVLARPANSPPTQSASSTTDRGSSPAHPLHPLAPLEAETSSPRYDSASSSQTSANMSGSTVSLHNASGQASGVTSGYYSTVASPGTDVSGASHVDLSNAIRDAESNSRRNSCDETNMRVINAEDAVDAESYPAVAQEAVAVSIENRPRFIEEVQLQKVSPERQSVRRVDISPPPKRQSAAARRVPNRPGRGVRVPLNRPRATTPGSLGSSAGSASLASMATGSLSSSLGNSTASLFADTLPGFDNPREALTRGLQQLDSMEWEVTMQALQIMVRLVRHHPAIVQGQLHACCESLSRQVKNLRSQVARAACQAASLMFHTLKRGMDAEAEDLSTALFNRTADTNKFLRADANTALDAMTDNVTPAKAVSAIVHKGCRHQNAVVRTAGARLLARLVEKLGVERMMTQPRETRDLMLLTSARLLMEGSLETRSYTKTLLKNLAQDHKLSAILVEIVPSNVMRSIDKTLKTCILRK